MRPADIQVIGEELAIRWRSGEESYIPLSLLRQHCPCAGCKGEVDVMGNHYRGPEQRLSSASYRLLRLNPVGGYAISPVWGDGHSTGIYSFEYLQKLSAIPPEPKEGKED